MAAALTATVILSCGAALAQLPQEEREAREALAQRMATMTMAILKDQKAKVADREDNLRRSFARVVDTGWIAKFVAGSSWRSASEEERERYAELYRDYLAHVYVSNYAENPDRKITDIKVIGVYDSETNEERFTARTEVVLSTAERLKVNYTVAAQEGGGYKIVDVIIEGVSLLSAHRVEFGKIAAKSGVSGIIAKLEEALNPGRRQAITLSMN